MSLHLKTDQHTELLPDLKQIQQLLSADISQIFSSQIGIHLKLLLFKVKLQSFPEKEQAKELIADILWELETRIGSEFRIPQKRNQKYSIQTMDTFHNFDSTTHSDDVQSLPVDPQVSRRVQKKIGKTLFLSGLRKEFSETLASRIEEEVKKHVYQLEGYKEVVCEIVEFLETFAQFYDWCSFASSSIPIMEFLIEFPFL